MSPAKDGAGSLLDDAYRAIAKLFERRASEVVDDRELDQALSRLEDARRRAGVSGLLDETLARFTPTERATAQVLVNEGSNVMALPVSAAGQPTADAAVDGVRTEFKKLTSSRSSKLTYRIGEASLQARRVVIDLRGSDLDRDRATRAAARSLDLAPRLDSVRLLGRGYDESVGRRR
jgi:hypothetical protein